MTITGIYKGTILTCLLVGVLAQDILEETPIAVKTTRSLALKEPSLSTENAEELAEQALADKLLEEMMLQEQAASAVYTFATSVVDEIMDNVQVRTETRDGLNLSGSYSYSDGYFKRTVAYVADSNGYRIVSETVEPLGDGPKIDLNGHAKVRTSIAGQDIEYSITKDDIAHLKKPLVDASAAAIRA